MPREKPLGAKERTNNKFNPHNDVDARIRTWATLVEASALTTTPSFSAPLKIIIVGTGDGLKQLRCE